MCGIAGYWDRGGGDASEAVLERMMDRIRHRGPDDNGTWVNGSLALGHLRLSILDLTAKAHQPFITDDGNGVLVYNGEVYNYLDLKKELELEGVQFVSTSDTEVVLYALHKWGPQRAIPRFNGMFGLAYFDRRDKTLWLSRDRLGIKPLYVAESNQSIVFASEIKALLAHPAVPCKPDTRALITNMLQTRLDGHRTLFEGVRALLPGTYWRVAAGVKEETVYFDPLRDVDVDRIVEASCQPLDELAGQFDDAMTNSVHIHLASDAPLASMCSGGLDSSLVTAIASAQRPDIVAYVANVDCSTPEGEQAKAVGRYLGIDVRQIEFALKDNMRLWPKAIWLSDQPNHHPHDMAFLAVMQACHKDGIKVLLTGEGADELFGGYSQQRDAYNLWKKRRLRHRLTPNTSLFRSWARKAPELFPLNIGALEEYPFADSSNSFHRLLFESCVLDSERHNRHAEIFERLARIEPIEDRAFLARGLSHLYGHLQSLLHRNDRMGMGASIESRVPFLENGLIDLGMHLPLAAKYYKGTEKWAVKESAKSKLPIETTSRRKQGFQMNLNYFSHAVPILQGGMVAEMFGWGTKSTGVLVEKISRNSKAAFLFVGLELWSRIFLNGESPENLSEKLISIAADSAPA